MSVTRTQFCRRMAIAVLAMWMASEDAIGQQQQMGSSQANQAIQLPASGRSQTAGNVSVEQNTSQSTNSNQPVISNLVVITGNYQGSVSGDLVPLGILRLSMSDAVKRGLLTNLGPLTANNEAATAAAQKLLAFSQLLPQVTASLSATETRSDSRFTSVRQLRAGNHM